MKKSSPTKAMVEMVILDQRLKTWGLPDYKSSMAAAVDLFACCEKRIELWPDSRAILISAGFSMHINDPSVCALILPRSGLAHKEGLVLGNSTGLIDADYTGPVMISVWNRSPSTDDPIVIAPGARIAQMVFVPIVQVSWSVVDAFSEDSHRGSGGFGSTGR